MIINKQLFHIRFKIIAHIFIVREHVVAQLIDGVILQIALFDHLIDTGPGIGMVGFVVLQAFRPDLDHFTDSLHSLLTLLALGTIPVKNHQTQQQGCEHNVLDVAVGTGDHGDGGGNSLDDEGTQQDAQHLAAAAPQHLAALGFSQEETQDFIARLRIPPQPIDVERDLPPYLHSALQNLWLGALDGRWYSVVMPLHTTEEAPFRAIADSNPNVFFANLTKDVGTELDSLTKIMLILMAVAMVAILLLLKLWYRLEEILRIGCIPLCIFLVTTATLTLLGIPLGFFSVAALLLVFGTGIDYIIYTLESERENRESSVSLAIFLSYATTAMSFGALALTSFRPVHLFGLTILTGLSAGYICSVLLRRQPSSS